MSFNCHHQDYTDAVPLDRIKLASEQIHRASIDPLLRPVAVNILKGKPPFGKSRKARNVPKDAPKIFADWIRGSFDYAQESPGVEILQGPHTSLHTRVIDCDDGAILWATLMRLVGLDAELLGVAKSESPWVFYHAVGLDKRTGLTYELSMDGWYGGSGNRSRYFRTPGDSVTVYYDPARGGYFISPGYGQPYRAVAREQLEGHHMRRNMAGQVGDIFAGRNPVELTGRAGPDFIMGSSMGASQAGDIYWGPNVVQLTGQAGPDYIMGFSKGPNPPQPLVVGGGGVVNAANKAGQGPNIITPGNRWSPRENMQPSITLGKTHTAAQQSSDNGWQWGAEETRATGGLLETIINTAFGDDGPDTVIYQEAESQPRSPAPAGINTGMAVTIGVVALLGVGALVMMGRS